MPFTEALKQSMRRRADMRCCLCRDLGVEIHHIYPEGEGGPDTEDNAAPLCPSCHERYGANPVKRKFIREARDNWLEICDQRFRAEHKLDSLSHVLSDVATNQALSSLKSELLDGLTKILNSPEPKPKVRALGDILRHLYEHSLPESKNGIAQATWLYEFIWENALGHDEFDQIKRDLVDHFGKETARRICHYVLQDHEFDILSSDGFTEPELEHLVNGVMVTAMVLLHHEDIVGAEKGFVIGIDPSGELRFWSAEFKPTLLKESGSNVRSNTR
jgi:hypothetical protein